METITAPFPATPPAPVAENLTFEQLTAALLARPERERAELAERLLESLPEPLWSDAAADNDDEGWDQYPPGYREEILRRIEDFDSRREQGVSWEVVKAEGRRIIEEETRRRADNGV